MMKKKERQAIFIDITATTLVIIIAFISVYVIFQLIECLS